MSSILQTWALPVGLTTIVSLTVTWYNYVSRQVPEPYLDEFFHVPQAQRYCIGDYSWDPKITTPPGLYLVSKLCKPLIGCETSSLRLLNAQALCIIFILSYYISRVLRLRNDSGQRFHEGQDIARRDPPAEDLSFVLDVHCALNIALFPPLFFFSALYYTDVMSTLAVLLAYSAFLKRSTTDAGVTTDAVAVVLGVISLLFRQTNIFWVAVFPAGLAVVDALKANTPSTTARREDFASILRESWGEGIIRDCSVQDAGPQDIVLFLTSIVVAAMRRPLVILKVAIPYITLLLLFAGFVAWNGSVVLGDKSAHTATIHLPQMLYIWPYIAFFSVPLLARPLIRPVVPLLPSQVREMCDYYLNTSNYGIPTTLVPVLFTICGLLVVYFNTIIHPYTLADNRHYVFYVFRIIRLYPALKYLAVPVYYICAWLTFQSLASPSIGEDLFKGKREDRPTNDRAHGQPCQVSFIAIWLVTTALSVITAPLVEPRYFIIPWIIWRLHVPCIPASLSTDRYSGKTTYDMRLVFETVWLLSIITVVSYIFLYRTFAWPSEPGNLQRFIW
ncbi:hypothetical protein BDW02DRAFT_230405 [Decorospora gaudefroyi]|uniref:Dol-P-Glc:Glc(2)Man(9)GlcNAc(2)-PP-Dol alpha-1,2-glucosyltransferase n=1 Tax=Decorospora gaudefroyi TaxID=184978 RepID=A0A6A5KWV5_9PLEO|nr:hypothetical protein BDW02DRAFT_230405 [Decorospora gaudefroyi]